MPISADGEPGQELIGSVRDVAPVQLSLVRKEADRLLWRELVGRYHYLGHKVPFGAQLRYLIRVSNPREAVVGCVQLSSPAWKVVPQDKWIGWDDQTRERNLQRIVNNSRFLILPWVKVKNLASHVLSKLAKELIPHWQEAYGIAPVLMEIFAVCDPFDDFAEQVTGAFQVWLESLRPTFAEDKPPTLRTLSELFAKKRGELLGACMKAAIEQLYRPFFSETTSVCALCGRTLCRKRIDPKTLSTMQGEFELDRPYFYCEHCPWSGHPLDIALGLARGRHQYDVQESMVRLTADLPYELSAEHFERLSGVGLGSHFAHTMLNEVVRYARFSDVIPKTEDIETRINEASQPGKSPPVLVIAIDGAHTPIRPPGGRKDKRGKGEWKETKGVRIYLTTSDDRIVHILSWHRNGDKKAFAWDLKRIAAGMPKTDLQVAALADGAPWIRKLIKKYFPAARQVLDYFHCAEHVHKVANEQYADPSAAVEWAEATLVRLSLGRTGEVIGGLRRMKSRNADAREEIRKLIGYIDANRRRLAYDDCKAQGIPKGSGGIESANKYIHHARLKRSGAWWLRPNTNGMLLIRCAVYNGTFNRVFDCHVAFQQELLNI